MTLRVLPLIFLMACGGTALERHVTAASMTRVSLDFGADAVEIVCAPDRVRGAEDPQSRAVACLRAIEGHELGRAAWLAWRDAIIASQGDEDILQAALVLAGPIVTTYDELVSFLAEFDIVLPPVPALLRIL